MESENEVYISFIPIDHRYVKISLLCGLILMQQQVLSDNVFFRKFRVAQTQLGLQLLGCTDSTLSVAQTQPIWNEKMCVDLNEYDILNQNAIFLYISTLAMKCF